MLYSNPRMCPALKNYCIFVREEEKMKVSKRNRGLSFLLALIMLVGMLPLLPTQNVSAEAYPALTNLVEGTEIY